jgi:GntR family transcriptional regulator
LLENITFPAHLCPSLLDEPSANSHDAGIGSFYDAVAANSGLRVTRAHEIFRPVALSGYEARLLAVPSGAAALQVERTSYSGGQPIEWRHTLARGDQFTFAVDLVNPLEQGELS